LLQGIAIMLVCYIVGRLLGGIAQRAIDEHTEQHRAEHPIPETADDLAGNPPASSEAAMPEPAR
jgi:hypothetical protein